VNLVVDEGVDQLGHASITLTVDAYGRWLPKRPCEERGHRWRAAWQQFGGKGSHQIPEEGEKDW